MTHDHAREAISHVGPSRTGAETDRAAARLAEDLAGFGDDLDLPPVMLGPDSTARIDAELARVRCSCGQPRPTDYREMPPVNPDGSVTFPPGYRPMPYDPAAAPRFNVTDAPKPTDATGADIVREYLRLSIVWNEKGAGLIGPAGDEAWYVARNRAAYDVTQFLGANLAALKSATGGCLLTTTPKPDAGGHTPEPWVVDKAKWGAAQWGSLEDANRGEPNLVGDVLPVLAILPCHENDDHDLCIRSRREDMQGHVLTDAERWANARLIAASPDLLAVAKSLRDIIHDDLTHAQQQHHAEAINFADLVIAKAGGGK